MARIDTHRLVKDLIKSGLPEKPSEILGKAFFSNDRVENFATRKQFAHLEKEQNDIKTDIKLIKSDIANIKENMATKTDIANMKIDIANVKTDILKWMIPLFLTIIGLIITSFFK